MKGLSLADLSTKMENVVTRQSIYKYESGKMLPDSTVLLKLSRVLGVKPDYFFRPFNVSLSGIEFRKKSSMSVKSSKAIEQRVLDKIERFYEIEDLLGIAHVPYNIPTGKVVHSEEDIISLVNEIRREWGLGCDGITDVIALLENKGIKVVEIDSANSFDGLSGFAGGGIVIVINSSRLHPERKRFTALHELGHLIMSFEEGIDAKKKEALCHLFASEFLIPQDSFRSLVGDFGKSPLNLIAFADIQRTFGISIDALIRKARDLSMISESRYRNYFIRKNQSASFKAYVEQSRTENEKPQRFETLVYDAYAKQLITASKAASLLDVPVDEVLNEAVFV